MGTPHQDAYGAPVSNTRNQPTARPTNKLIVTLVTAAGIAIGLAIAQDFGLQLPGTVDVLASLLGGGGAGWLTPNQDICP